MTLCNKVFAGIRAQQYMALRSVYYKFATCETVIMFGIVKPCINIYYSLYNKDAMSKCSVTSIYYDQLSTEFEVEKDEGSARNHTLESKIVKKLRRKASLLITPEIIHL